MKSDWAGLYFVLLSTGLLATTSGTSRYKVRVEKPIVRLYVGSGRAGYGKIYLGQTTDHRTDFNRADIDWK